MRYHGRVNYVKCLEWGITNTEGSLFDLLHEAPSWAKAHVIDGEVYFWVSRNKILSELPVVYNKIDTIYRHLRTLVDKDLIIYRKEGVKDLIMLTDKGKTWNAKINSEIIPSLFKHSEINPSLLGNISEQKGDNSEIFPTYKDTSNKGTNNKEVEKKGTDDFKKTATLISVDFKPTAEQVAKMTDFGINAPMLVESFISYNLGLGKAFLCWHEMFTVYLNNHVTQNRLSSIHSKPFVKAVSNTPANNEQSYHPSYKSIDSTPAPSVGGQGSWHWNEPLPNMSIAETYEYLAAHRIKGETNKGSYDRLFNELLASNSK